MSGGEREGGAVGLSHSCNFNSTQIIIPQSKLHHVTEITNILFPSEHDSAPPRANNYLRQDQ